MAFSKFFSRLSPLFTTLCVGLSACGQKNEPPPEPTLDTECPHVKDVKLATIPSDYPLVNREEDIVFDLNGNIFAESPESISEFVSNITTIAALPADEKPRLHLNVSSLGGDPNLGMALADAVQHYGSKNTTVLAIGNASSAASLVLLAVDKAYGYASTQVLVHGGQYDRIAFSALKPEDKKNLLSDVERTTGNIRSFYEEKLALSERCAVYLTSETVDRSFSGDSALKIGFMDAVLIGNGKMRVRADDIARFSSPYQQSHQLK